MAEVAEGERADPAAEAGVTRWVNVPALLAILIWSGVFPFAKYALDEFPVMAYTALRPLLAALLIFGLLRWRGRPVGIAREDWPRMLAAGFGGMAVFQIFFIVGLERTSASHSALLLAASPLIGAGILWAAGQFVPTARSVGALALGFAGVALLVQGGGASGQASLSGDLLTLVAAVGWVLVTVLPAPLIGRYGPLRVAAWLILAAAVATLPLAIPEIARTIREMPSLLAWLSLIYSAVLGMLVANALWQRAIHALGSRQTMVYMYLQPLLAVLLAALLLGERLGPLQVVGGIVVLLGVGLVRR